MAGENVVPFAGKIRIEDCIREHGGTYEVPIGIAAVAGAGEFQLIGGDLQLRTGKTWLTFCSRIDVLAETRSEDGVEHGRLIRVYQRDGATVDWVLPMRMLGGDGKEYRAELASLGVRIPVFDDQKHALAQYLISVIPVRQITYYTKVGWTKEGTTYVRGDRLVGKEEGTGEVSVAGASGYAVSGTVEEWREKIGRECEGEAYLTFAVSAALAAPFLRKIGLEGGGFHFQGESSTGKTTLLRVAGSVWGDGKFLRSWRATDNAMETMAQEKNDCLLCLDEIAMVAPTAAGQAAYMLAQGEGKGRLKKTGDARSRMGWRLLFLSTGEIGLEEKIGELGADNGTKAGQQIRTLSIPVEGEFGILRRVGDRKESAAKIARLHLAVESAYGTASVGMLEEWLKDEPGNEEKIRQWMAAFIERLSVGMSAQALRGIQRFAFVAAVGRLAEECGLLPFTGQAEPAAEEMFGKWCGKVGGGGKKSIEQDQVIWKLKKFIQSQEERFTDWVIGAMPENKARNRVGFKRSLADGVHYYIFPESWKDEVMRGLDGKEAANRALKLGVLKGQGGKTSDVTKLPGFGSTAQRVYHILPMLFKLDSGEDD